MLAVEVELLTGRYVATRFNDRDRVEWPPHPARLFSAAVALWADADEPSPRERDALAWWERQGAPQITCSWNGNDRPDASPSPVSERAVVTHYVPVNDAQVVARDTSETYRKLRSALDALETAETADDARAVKKAARQVDKLRAKAVDEAQRVGSSGSAPTEALAILPDERGRQPRTYPTAVPADGTVVYTWPDADDVPRHAEALDGLLARIGRLGHSSSFVSVAVTDSAPAPVLVPDDSGDVAIRVAAPGQVDALEAAYAFHQGTELRALPARVAPYREAGDVRPVLASSHFSDDWIVLAPRSRSRLTVRDTLAFARGVRGALMRWADQPAPRVISGHAAGPTGEPTAPTDRPHVAFVPLPFVGHSFGDGSVQAIALLLPSDASQEERDHVLVAVGRWLDATGGQGRLLLGRRGAVTMERVATADAPRSATAGRWRAPATCWLTATPIALDRNPGDLGHADPARREAAEAAAEVIIARACTNIGLPAPVAVTVRRDAPVTGTRPVRGFPRYAVQAGRLQRVLVHAEIVFAERVRGPVVLGAGRYLGYGLCVPMPDIDPVVRHDEQQSAPDERRRDPEAGT